VDRSGEPQGLAAIAGSPGGDRHKARPIIAGFEFQVETQPVGGFSLSADKSG
jgi:hypothetical protein